MDYRRSIESLQEKAILWWPKNLNDANQSISIVPKLLETQDDFLRILSLAKNSPYQIFDLLEATKFPANLFLKHLCVLADYGGEPIQRLGRAFPSLFQVKENLFAMDFFWNAQNYNYIFQELPKRGLGNKKLFLDGLGLRKSISLSNIYRDMIVILMFGSTSNCQEEAGLSSCNIGTLLGKSELLEMYVKQRYIIVSRITGGARSNALGQYAQQEIVAYLQQHLPSDYTIVSNGNIFLEGYEKERGMPFDIVVKHGENIVGIEVSFQVTTNSVIERKAGQSADRMKLMHEDGYHIAYVLDGAGNFQRSSAVSNICKHSDCTVAYSPEEFRVLVNWLQEIL